MRWLFWFIVLLLSAVFCLSMVAMSRAALIDRINLYLPEYEKVVDVHWPSMPMPYIPCGQIEQESSWNPRAELKTDREYGFGFGQITITERFNNFDAATRLRALQGWKWENRFDVKNQLIYVVITDKSNFKIVHNMMADDVNRWAASMVAYNAGLGTVLQRRSLALSRGVNSRIWFGGLDSVFLKYEDRLLYGRKLGPVRNEYPIKVFKRSEKYIHRLKIRGQ